MASVAKFYLAGLYLDGYLISGPACRCGFGKFMLTCFEQAVAVGGALRHDVLDLQELLVRVVSADDREAEAARTLRQHRLVELAFELLRVSREEALVRAVRWKHTTHSVKGLTQCPSETFCRFRASFFANTLFFA